MDPNRKGDINEYAAVHALLLKGFEVFKNICSTGPIDLVAYNPETGETIFIDVKDRARKTEIHLNGIKLHHMHLENNLFQLVEARHTIKQTSEQDENLRRFMESRK
jgi:Holliday junction resolvase-like predicted endonuclease